MKIDTRFSVICSTFASLWLLTNAILEDSEVAISEISVILNDAYTEASLRLLGEAVVKEDNFKDFLRGKTVDQFMNDQTAYDKFKNQLYLYYIGYLFFGTYPTLKDSVNCFTNNWVKQNSQKNPPTNSYTADFISFLEKDPSNKKELEIIESLENNLGDLRISIEQVLTAKVNLAYTKLASEEVDKVYYDELFKSIEENKFETSLTKFTVWRSQILNELAEIEELVRELYESFKSLDAFDKGDSDDDLGELKLSPK